MSLEKETEKFPFYFKGKEYEVTRRGSSLMVGKKGSEKIKPVYINGYSVRVAFEER